MQSYLNGAPNFRSPWSSFFENAGHDPELAGYFWEADKRYLLAFVVPNSTESGFLGTRGALIRLRELIRDTRALYPGIQAGVTGHEALKIDEVSTVSKDMATATWLSLVGVFILMVVFFRSFRRPCLQITYSHCRAMLDLWLDHAFYRPFEYPLGCLRSPSLRFGS